MLKATRVFVLAALGLMQWGCASQEPAKTAPEAAVSKYEGKVVKRPGGPGDDGKVYIVQGGKKRWVVNASWFAPHGYKFPEDVREIPAADFEAIPTGEAIQ